MVLPGHRWTAFGGGSVCIPIRLDVVGSIQNQHGDLQSEKFLAGRLGFGAGPTTSEQRMVSVLAGVFQFALHRAHPVSHRRHHHLACRVCFRQFQIMDYEKPIFPLARRDCRARSITRGLPVRVDE